MFRILVTSKSFAKHVPELIEEMEGQGIVIERPSHSNIDSDGIASIIGNYDGLICGIDTIDKKVIDSGNNLKFIHMNGTGVDHIDVEYATKKNIFVGNCPGVNANAVAECNVTLMLAEAKKIVKHSNYIYDGEWKRNPGVELYGKTLGVIGVGYIGKRLVEMICGFNMRVVVYDIDIDYDWVKKHDVEVARDVAQIYKESDFISLNVPLLESTANMIDEQAISQMKKNVIIVNAARGGLIDTKAIIDAVKNKRIGGAALDAFVEEPIDRNSELLDLDITLTPHIAASTIETAIKVSQVVARNVVDYLIKGDGSMMINYDEVLGNDK